MLSQTHRDLELVVYDDAGDLEDVTNAFADARLRYHRATHRLQVSGRFAAAVALCRGEIIGLLDDDDHYAPTFVERLLRVFVDDQDAGVAFCRTTWDVDGQRYAPRDHRGAGVQIRAAEAMLRAGWTVSPSHMLLRRAAVEAAMRDQSMPEGVAPDAFLNMRVALAGWRHVLVDAPLVVCRWHAGQLSRGGTACDMSVATWQQLRIDTPALAALRDRRLARVHLVRALERLRAGDHAWQPCRYPRRAGVESRELRSRQAGAGRGQHLRRDRPPRGVDRPLRLVPRLPQEAPPWRHRHARARDHSLTPRRRSAQSIALALRPQRPGAASAGADEECRTRSRW